MSNNDLKRYVRIHIDHAFMEDLLNFPPDVRIIGAHPSAPWEPIELWLEGERFPELREGAAPPLIRPCYQTVVQKVAKLDVESLQVKDAS